MEEINWANVFARLAEKPKEVKSNNTDDWAKYFRDFINGFNKK